MENKQEKPKLNIHEERFEKLMRLIRIDRMLKSATITHQKITGRPKDLIDVIELERIKKERE